MAPRNKVEDALSMNFSEKKSKLNSIPQKISWETGNIKPINTGVKQNKKAKNDLIPLISFSVIGLKFDASCVKADLDREILSEMKKDCDYKQ